MQMLVVLYCFTGLLTVALGQVPTAIPTAPTEQTPTPSGFSSTLFPPDSPVLYCYTCDSDSPAVSGNCTTPPLVPCREVEQSCVKIVKGGHMMKGCLMDGETKRAVRMEDHCYTDVKRRRTCVCNESGCNAAPHTNFIGFFSLPSFFLPLWLVQM
ncbi:hypothetical protein M3Y99_00747800 [Aphelenchoides fujianensis]|nr:hypothetical protein M3Y99_00747800 [Aphelenchoides fujianensis]